MNFSDIHLPSQHLYWVAKLMQDYVKLPIYDELRFRYVCPMQVLRDGAFCRVQMSKTIQAWVRTNRMVLPQWHPLGGSHKSQHQQQTPALLT